MEDRTIVKAWKQQGFVRRTLRPLGTVAASALVQGHMAYAKRGEQACAVTGVALSRIEPPTRAGFSSMGRTGARALESKGIGGTVEGWHQERIGAMNTGKTRTSNDTLWDPAIGSAHGVGARLTAVLRGALAQWAEMRNRLIEHYQALLPRAWRGGSWDAAGQTRPFEGCAWGLKFAVAHRSPEILRRIHSVDPCICQRGPQGRSQW